MLEVAPGHEGGIGVWKLAVPEVWISWKVWKLEVGSWKVWQLEVGIWELFTQPSNRLDCRRPCATCC